jgi:hypothetical protein
MISALNFKIGGGGGACADATVKNSDNTYNTTTASGSTLTLPNITVTDSDGTTSSVPAVTNVTCKLSPVGATLMKTGQTTSYRTGDDGDIEAGRATSFTVLASNNPWGNTNRFTDTLGGQTYANNIIIDWSTYNNVSVLAYYKGDTVLRSWNDQIDQYLSSTIGGLNSWRMFNIYEAVNIMNLERISNYVYNYAPFNIGSSPRFFWTSNRGAAATGNAVDTFAITLFTSTALVGSLPSMWVRTCIVTGTTLS